MITEASILIPRSRTDDLELRCYASILVDGWLRVSDLRVIHVNDRYFVCCPTRQLHIYCTQCHKRHVSLDMFCPYCGVAARGTPAERAERKAARFDVVHPIHAEGRQIMEAAVIECFLAEDQQTQQPGYTNEFADYALTWKGWPQAPPQPKFLGYRQPGHRPRDE